MYLTSTLNLRHSINWKWKLSLIKYFSVEWKGRKYHFAALSQHFQGSLPLVTSLQLVFSLKFQGIWSPTVVEDLRYTVNPLIILSKLSKSYSSSSLSKSFNPVFASSISESLGFWLSNGSLLRYLSFSNLI